MPAIQPPPVYWIEADEEASLFVSGKQGMVGRRSLLAYLLLGRRVVAHPADLWQSSYSNSLIFHEQAQPLLRKAVQLHLGDSNSVADYITDRVEKLKRDRASSQMSAVELGQYLQHGELLKEQSAMLDDNFTKSGATFRVQGSRDLRFRKLVRRDLADETPFGPHLAASIRQGLDRNGADRMLKTLGELAHDRRRFISIDGIISRLLEYGCPTHILRAIHGRLQVLHWESRSEGVIELPLLARAKRAGLEAADPDVFWLALDGLLGTEFQLALMSLPWPTAIGIVAELRGDSVWVKFIETYDAIVDTVERDHDEISEELVRAGAQKKYPSLFRLAVNNRPDKITVLSWVCGIGSWCVGGFELAPLLFRAGSTFASVTRGYDWARKLIGALYCSERHLLKSRIRNLIAEATKTK